jgi:hypothetical protein
MDSTEQHDHLDSKEHEERAAEAGQQLIELRLKDVHGELLDEDDDERIAFRFLFGIYGMKNGRVTFRYASSKTTPTEEEDGRLAVASLLFKDRPPRWLLYGLAFQFAPGEGEFDRRILVFKHASKRRTKPDGIDFQIGLTVQLLRDDGHCYEKAIASAAKTYGYSERHIKRIYARCKREFEPLPAMTSGERSDDMTSD